LVPSFKLDQELSGPGLEPWWRTIERIDHGHLSGLQFIPTDLLAYLRPDGVNLLSNFPWVATNLGPSPYGVHYIFGVSPGGIFAENYTTWTDMQPLAFIAGFCALVSAVRRVRSSRVAWREVLDRLIRSPMTWCVLGAAAMLGETTSLVGLSIRYTSDAYLCLVTLTLVSARALWPSIERLSRNRVILLCALVAIVTGWSLFVTSGVEYSYWEKAVL
jgi:hypothetical protein